MTANNRFSRYDITEEIIQKRYREKRGKGRGRNYKPWIKVSDLSSLGLSCRVPGRRNGRIHHLLSSLELRAFLDFEFDRQIIDIREQYPLDRELTRKIALSLGFTHPRARKTGVDIVMTTDFLLTYIDEHDRQGEQAVSVKYLNEFDNKRVREKLEIERKYWNEERGVDFVIYTEEESSVYREVNYRSLKAHDALEPIIVNGKDVTTQLSNALIRAIETQPSHLTLSELWRGISHQENVEPRHLPALFYHLAAHDKIKFDVNRRFDSSNVIGSLTTKRVIL